MRFMVSSTAEEEREIRLARFADADDDLAENSISEINGANWKTTFRGQEKKI